MHEAFADRICRGMDGAARAQPFGPAMVVWTIDGHMFAAYSQGGEGLSLRVPQETAQRLAAEGPRPHEPDPAQPGWVMFPWTTPPEDLRRHIAASYALVKADGNG